MDLIEMPSVRVKSRTDIRNCDRPKRGGPANVPDAKAANASSTGLPEISDTEFGGPDCETLAPLARMILVLEGMRSCANDKTLSEVPGDTNEISDADETAPKQSGAETGWAFGVLADMHSMFERDWTPEPIKHHSAKLFGTTIIPVNDTVSSNGHSETRRS